MEAVTNHVTENAGPAGRRNLLLMQQDSRRRIVMWLTPQGGTAGFFPGSNDRHHGGINPWHSI